MKEPFSLSNIRVPEYSSTLAINSTHLNKNIRIRISDERINAECFYPNLVVLVIEACQDLVACRAPCTALLWSWHPSKRPGVVVAAAFVVVVKIAKVAHAPVRVRCCE